MGAGEKDPGTHCWCMLELFRRIDCKIIWIISYDYVLGIRIHNQQYFTEYLQEREERDGFPEHVAFVSSKTPAGKRQVLHYSKQNYSWYCFVPCGRTQRGASRNTSTCQTL